MKFQIDQTVLWRELALLVEVVESKAMLATPASLLLEATGNHLLLSAHGFSSSLCCQINADVTTEGSVCLPVRKLGEIVRQLPKAPIHFSATGEGVTLTCKGSRFRLNTSSTENFPVTPQAEEFTLTLPGDTLAAMIRATFFAASKNAHPGNFSLEGANLTIAPEGARMVATDGSRLMCVERTDVTYPETISILIPKTSLGIMAKLLEITPGEVRLQPTENGLYLQTENRWLTCSLLTGQYPDVAALLAQPYLQSLTFDGAEFRAAVTRMAIFGADGTEQNFGLIELQLKPDVCELAGANPYGSESHEEMTPLTPVNSEETKFTFNGRFLHDFARTISNTPLTIRFNDANSSVEFQPVETGGLHSRYILMPCRI
jgi:DNA polymerase III subunit beta